MRFLDEWILREEHKSPFPLKNENEDAGNTLSIPHKDFHNDLIIPRNQLFVPHRAGRGPITTTTAAAALTGLPIPSGFRQEHSPSVPGSSDTEKPRRQAETPAAPLSPSGHFPQRGKLSVVDCLDLAGGGAQAPVDWVGDCRYCSPQPLRRQLPPEREARNKERSKGTTCGRGKPL